MKPLGVIAVLTPFSNVPFVRSLECCDHFQIDEAHLATACERTSVHYLRVSGYRYDPAERLEKLRRFAGGSP